MGGAPDRISRTATADAVVDGIEVRAGTSVNTSLGSANHDPSRWDDPEVFDIFRQPKSHIAFATGAAPVPGHPPGPHGDAGGAGAPARPPARPAPPTPRPSRPTSPASPSAPRGAVGGVGPRRRRLAARAWWFGRGRRRRGLGPIRRGRRPPCGGCRHRRPRSGRSRPPARWPA